MRWEVYFVLVRMIKHLDYILKQSKSKQYISAKHTDPQARGENYGMIMELWRVLNFDYCKLELIFFFINFSNELIGFLALNTTYDTF